MRARTCRRGARDHRRPYSEKSAPIASKSLQESPSQAAHRNTAGSSTDLQHARSSAFLRIQAHKPATPTVFKNEQIILLRQLVDPTSPLHTQSAPRRILTGAAKYINDLPTSVRQLTGSYTTTSAVALALPRPTYSSPSPPPPE